jgi:cobalt/nickel transport system ATP-binding protein
VNEPVLSFQGVTVRYEPGSAAILRALDLDLAAGERVALLGLNGSGKTTLLKAAVGLLPHEGVIRVCGETLGHATLAGIRARVGFLFNQPEDQLLFPEVLDDVAFGLRRKGVPLAEARTRARAALAALGAEALANQDIHQLSHGQKQRVALAGALATEPELLLLDEPSAALDPPGRERLAALLRGLGTGMLMATHDLAFAQACCTRMLVLDGGRLEDRSL